MKKIMSINCNCTSGGGKGMMEVAKIARNSGFDYYTVSPQCRNDGGLINHVTITNRLQKCLNRNISQIIGNDNAVPFAETKKLINTIEIIKPDLIHLRGLHGWYVDYIQLLRYLSEKKIPIVWTQHDCWAFTGKCVYFHNADCYKWKDKCGSCPQLHSYPNKSNIDRTSMMFRRKKETFTLLPNCRVVTVSKWMESIVRDSFLSCYDIMTIENGIDTHVFCPTRSDILQRYGLNGKFVILGVASSWSERKGLNDFLELSKRLNEDEVIVLIGVNEKTKTICQNQGIIGIDRTSDKAELASWYSMCGAYFNPSTEETFGRVTAEAMACGSPIIAYDATATPELLEGTNNFCVKPHDLEQVLQAIKKIKITPREFYSLGNIEKARRSYDMETQFSKYIDLYNEMLNKGE